MDWTRTRAYWRRLQDGMSALWSAGSKRVAGRASVGAEDAADGSAAAHAEPRSVEAWQLRLVEHGVTEEWAPRVAEQLAPLHRELGPGSAPALLQAATATFVVQREAHAEVERNLKDVREVERLLGAFSGELEKLDEVLEVLAAYAQRMRAQPAKKPRHTLH